MNGRPRSEVQRDLDLLQREIAEYHRWLAEFPQVCRVLENLSLRIGAPLPGTSATNYRSVSNLREELRAHGEPAVQAPSMAELIAAALDALEDNDNHAATVILKTAQRADGVLGTDKPVTENDRG